MTEFYEHIGDYIGGQLTGDDLISFEQELAVNKELQEAVENHDIVEELLDLMWEEEARKVLDEAPIEETIPSKPSLNIKETKTRSLRRFVPLAAALLVLLAVGFLFKDHFKAPLSNEQLFAKHYSEYMGQTVRGEEATDSEISICDQGHYYLDKGDITTAKKLFLLAVNQKANSCTQKSYWYLCLIYLKEGNEKERDGLLRSMVNNKQHNYHSKAVKLQADLN